MLHLFILIIVNPDIQRLNIINQNVNIYIN